MAIFMAMLLCLLLFPHKSFGTELDCPSCAAGLECQDLCDCQDHGAECVLDASHTREFRNDTTQNPGLDLAPVELDFIALPLDIPQKTAQFAGSMAGTSSHSFAVRHLDTIILRV